MQNLLAQLDGSLALRKYIAKELIADIASPNFKLVDVGAYGQEHHRWNNFPTGLKQLRFDPNFKTEQKLNKDVRSVALSEFGKNFALNITSKPEVSSCFDPNKDFLQRFADPDRFKVESIEEVPSMTLKETLGEGYWFAKLDVQGMELPILRGAGSRINEMIGLEVELEFLPIYKGQPLADQLLEYLRDRGLEFIDFLSFYSWPRLGYSGPGQLVFVDALFLRTPEWVVSQADLELCRHYLATCLIYGRFDLAGALVELEPKLASARLERILSNLTRRFAIQTRLVKVAQNIIRPILRGSTIYLSK